MEFVKHGYFLLMVFGDSRRQKDLDVEDTADVTVSCKVYKFRGISYGRREGDVVYTFLRVRANGYEITGLCYRLIKRLVSME